MVHFVNITEIPNKKGANFLQSQGNMSTEFI